MLKKQITNILSSFVIILFISGCSSVSDTSAPSTGNWQKSPNPIPVGVTSRFANGTVSDGMGTLGLFTLRIDKSNLKAELSPIRKSSLTDVLESVDITNFLYLAPCVDCAMLKSVSLDIDGNIVLSIGIKHPFDAGDPLKPITGRNRADLHVFNVEGTVISSSDGTSFPGVNETTAGFKLMNADGYSGYMDTALDDVFPTPATVHPYITHFDDYSSGNYDPLNPMGFTSVTEPPPGGNLVMAMGCSFDFQNYVFNASEVPHDFIFAVGCTYAVSASSKLQRFTPEYRIPQHNKKAASEVGIEIISNDLRGGDTSSTAEIQIRVVDINHGVAVGEALNEMLSDSSVNSILVEIPGVTSSPLIVDISSPTGTGHDPSDPLVFTATVTNTAGGMEGIYSGLVKVTDSYAPGQNGSPLLSGMDGIERVDPLINPLEGLFEIDEFATYQTFTIDVSVSNYTPVAILAPDPAQTYQYQEIDFDATASYDTDGTITLYEFDFDWDGVEANFTIDASNTTGSVTSPEYNTPGSYIAGLRVTDNMSAQAYDSVSVTINPCGQTIVSWDMTLPQMNLGRRYPASIVIDDQLWIMSSESFSTSIEVFDLATETWLATPRAPLPSPRAYFGIAHYEGKIYCMGGYTGARLNTQVVYDIASNTWDSTHPNMPGPGRNVCRAVVYEDEIYLCYGLVDIPTPATPCKRLDIYDPVNRTWRSGADAPYGRSSPIWVLVGNKIWALGNNNMSNPNPGYNLIEYYDLVLNTWTSLPSTITFTRWRGSPGYIAIGSKIYVVGGQQNANVNAYAWVDYFDTQSQTWTSEIDLLEDRGYDPAVAYYHCELYAGAGGGDNMTILRSIRKAIFN